MVMLCTGANFGTIHLRGALPHKNLHQCEITRSCNVTYDTKMDYPVCFDTGVKSRETSSTVTYDTEEAHPVLLGHVVLR